MSDSAPTGQESTEQVSNENSQGEVNQSDPSGGNPAWEPFRSSLDPENFSKVEPHLREWDQGVQKRFEAYKPWESFIKDRDPTETQAYVDVAQRLNDSPAEVYTQLKAYLTANGMLPEEAAAAAADAVGDPEDDEPQAPHDPRLDQWEAWMQEQQFAKEVETQNKALDQQLARITEKHGFSAAENNELIQRSLAQANATGKTLSDADFDRIAQGIADYKQSILTTPRPSDSAPDVLTPSGGNPQGGQQKPVAQLKPNDRVNLVADMLKRGSK